MSELMEMDPKVEASMAEKPDNEEIDLYANITGLSEKEIKAYKELNQKNDKVTLNVHLELIKEAQEEEQRAKENERTVADLYARAGLSQQQIDSQSRMNPNNDVNAALEYIKAVKPKFVADPKAVTTAFASSVKKNPGLSPFNRLKKFFKL